MCGAEQLCDVAVAECVDLPASVCGGGTRWAAGTRAFEEATASWGLEGVEGIRVGAVDFDGDGWTDLNVRRLPSGTDTIGRMWLLRNTGDGRFEDVTESSGILTPRVAPPGSRRVDVLAWGDVDGDGDLDAYLGLGTADRSAVMNETSEILFQDTPGHFVLGPEDNEVRWVGGIDVPAGAAFADVDLDGDLDLWVGQHNHSTAISIVFHQSRLWRNDGTGRFADATVELGLETSDWSDLAELNEGRSHARAWSAAACDLNDDGLPELLVASYGRAPNHLFQASRADGAVAYTNRSVASGYSYDADLGWSDNQFARCYCEANPTAEGCAGVPAPLIGCDTPNWSHEQDTEPFRLGGNSGSTICGDLDNDGDLDLLTTEIKHWWAGSGADGAEILVNGGESDVRFERPGRAATGLEIVHADPVQWDEGFITAAVLDFDLDGWTDVWLGGSEYPGNHGLLFHNVTTAGSGPRFESVPIADGIDHHRAQGVVVADFDRDGDLDVVLGHSRARCGAPDDCYPTSQVRFFENVVGDDGNSIALRLEGGDGANRSAIGARVTVTAGGITQTQDVEGGHGHYGDQGDLVLTFGLGAACEADVSVRWPDAELTEQTFHVGAGHRYLVRRGRAPRADDPE